MLKEIEKLKIMDLQDYSCKHLFYNRPPNDIKILISEVCRMIFKGYIITGRKLNHSEHYDFIGNFNKTFSYIGSKNGYKFDLDELLNDFKVESVINGKKEFLRIKKNYKKAKKELKKYYKIKLYAKKLKPDIYFYTLERCFDRYFEDIREFKRNQTVKFFEQNKKFLKIK